MVGELQWIALLTAGALACCALLGGLRRRQALDWLYLGATVPFACLAGVELLAAAGHLQGELAVVVAPLVYQTVILGVSAFLMVLLRGGRRWHRWLVGGQAVLGGALAVGVGPGGLPGSVGVWAGFNLAVTALLVLLLVRALRRHRATRGWTVLMVAIAALSVMLTDLYASEALGPRVSWAQVLILPMLAVLWLRRTSRVGAVVSAPTLVPAANANAMPPLDRQQLAQDLHDGVGSHLSSIISALEHGTPDERITAAALQECLIELKLLVDGVDEDASVVSLLANLRYRMQPLLGAAGIDMHWQLADEELLDQVRDGPAREILRIAQECLANVVHHSGASEVTVIVCQLKAQRALMLEIVDNGHGMTGLPGMVVVGNPGAAERRNGRPLGKGLPGMRRRARLLGGRLVIGSAPGEGTRVTLLVPLQHLLQPAAA